jgi:hypothetical protein
MLSDNGGGSFASAVDADCINARAVAPHVDFDDVAIDDVLERLTMRGRRCCRRPRALAVDHRIDEPPIALAVTPT